MSAILKPKCLPWLARQAGMPDHLVETQWVKALAMAGASASASASVSRAPSARCQAVAMQYLLLMLGCGTDRNMGGDRVLPGKWPTPLPDAVCQ